MADEKSKSITEPGDVAGLGLTPIFSNRFQVIVNPATTRIAFGEYVAGDPDNDTAYQTVIVAPTKDAVGLAQLILRLFAQNQARQQDQEDSKAESKADGDG